MRLRIANRGDQQIENVTWPWEGSQTLPKHSDFHTLDPASHILAHAYAHRKNRGDQQIENVTWPWEGSQTLPKHSDFHTLDPASHILAHAYAHRKNRGDQQVENVTWPWEGWEGSQTLPKHSVSLPIDTCILHFSTHVCASQIAGINRSKM